MAMVLMVGPGDLPAALPPVDVAEPASMLLLPDWLGLQLSAVSDPGAGRTVVDRTTREIVARVPTIPQSKMPTGPQRTAIERRVTELRAADAPGPAEDIIAYVGDLILEYATARLDERTVTAKAGAYLDTLGDLPAWAVREAIRRWRRGEVDADAQTLDVAPRPARLRHVAERIALVARGQASRLQRVLDAVAEDEPDEAARGEMQRRLGDAIRPQTMAGTKPAGTASRDKAEALSALDTMEAAARAEASSSEPEPTA